MQRRGGMAASSNKILVKVGKKSNVKFRGVQAFRAITIDELYTLSKINPDASIVIIENIKHTDDEKLKKFISEFETGGENRKVFFYVADNDDATCGVADELAYDIYLNIKDLYRAIKINCGITVDPDLSLSAEFIGADDLGDDIFDESFQDALDTVSKVEIKEEKLPDIESKSDIDDFDTSIMDEDEDEHVEETKPIKIDTVKKDSAEAEKSVEVPKVNVDEYTKKIDELKNKLSASTVEIDSLKDQLHNAFENSKKLTKLVKAVEEERDTFKAQLKMYDTKEVMEEPITLAVYKELEDKIAQLTEQGPSVPTAELEELQRQLTVAEEQKKEAESKLEDYKTRLRESGSKLSDAQDKLLEANETVEKLRNEVTELKDSANKTESAELQSANAGLIAVKAENDKLRVEIKEQQEIIDNAQSEIKKLSAEIESMTLRIEHEVESRLFILSILANSVKEYAELENKTKSSDKIIESLRSDIEALENYLTTVKNKNSELEAKLEEYKDTDTLIIGLKTESETKQQLLDDKDTLINSLNLTINEKETKIVELQAQVDDVDKRIELAHNFSKQELETAKREAIEWKTKYDIVHEQFTSKEAQYNTLIQTVGMNESGVSSLLENNRTMDEINKTLRDQIVMLKADLDKATRDRQFAQQTAAKLEETAKNMRVSMKAMTVGMTGGVTTSSGVAPFNYQGRGMVIPVFGSGSYGTTTAAMSIANRLATQARVLYIDFDLVAPKADAWFKTNPLIRNVPEVEPNSTKATGLGLFIDKQVQYFLSNVNSLILKPIQTKNGCIDYLSGFYSKPDTIKLMSADYASFLNYCGNTYTYVVIDFGRLGSSDINDQLIKAFTDVAYRSVCVTTSDKFEIRTFRMKMGEARIDLNNVAWLVNMCERTSIEDTAKRAISPANYGMVPFDPDIYGKKLDFTKERLTRDKFNIFLEKVILRK